MPNSTDALLEQTADQIGTSDERCVAAEKSRRQTDLHISTSREVIRRSRDQLARLAAIER